MKSLILFLAIISYAAEAQVIQELTFNEKAHNFGSIKELDGPVEFKFEFINTGAEPITITNVRPSCGCTSSGWTKEPVAPGESGYVSAVYNPLNRPGPFSKSLTVSTSGQTKTLVLRINGQVEPKPRSIEDDYPTVVGGLRVKYKALNMGRIYNNEPSTKSFDVYNNSDSVITFVGDIEGPAYIGMSFEPTSLEPKMKGKIMVTYDATQKSKLGFMSDNVVFFTSESGTDAKKSFTIYADINEYFPPLTPEEIAMAPRLLIEDQVFDFGKITQGEEVQTQFILKNDGQKNLNFRQTKSSCGCTVVAMPSMDLAPGESMSVTVAFDSKGRRGVQQKSITLYTNDPVSPVQRITVKAIVELSGANN